MVSAAGRPPRAEGGCRRASPPRLCLPCPGPHAARPEGTEVLASSHSCLVAGHKAQGRPCGGGQCTRARPAGEPQPGAAGQGSGPGPPATLLRPCLLGAVTWMYSHHREVSFFSAPQNRRREVSVVAENRRRGAAGTSPSAPASPSPAPRPPGGLAAGLLFHVAFHWGGTGDGRGGERRIGKALNGK